MFSKYLAKKIITNSYLEFPTTNLVSWFETNIVHLQKWALIKSDFFSEKDWKGIQITKLKKILMRANYNIPYWHGLFKRINFVPEEFQRLEDLQKIPITTRADIKKIPLEKVVDQAVVNKRALKVFTSGSTGEPLAFFQDSKELSWRRAGILKELHNFGVVLDRPALILGLYAHKQLDQLGFRFSSDSLEAYDQRTKILYPFIITQKPEVIIGTPSLLNRFIFFLEKDGLHPLPFRIIRYTGESMSTEERKALSKKFGCPIYTQYGTRECSYIGMECEQGKLHFTPWINYVEIVDDGSGRFTNGNEGKVIVTYFENEVMPFIRYDIGDMGSIRKELCSCGRKTPTITFIGRTPGVIELPSGKQIIVLKINSKIAETFSREITRFQLEEREDTFIFRLVPTVNFVEETEKALSSYFQELFNGEKRCILEKVKHIPPTPEGKTPLFSKKYS